MRSMKSKETSSKTVGQERASQLIEMEKKLLFQSTWSNSSSNDPRALVGADLYDLGFSQDEILDMVGKHYGDF